MHELYSLCLKQSSYLHYIMIKNELLENKKLQESKLVHLSKII